MLLVGLGVVRRSRVHDAYSNRSTGTMNLIPCHITENVLICMAAWGWLVVALVVGCMSKLGVEMRGMQGVRGYSWEINRTIS